MQLPKNRELSFEKQYIPLILCIILGVDTVGNMSQGPGWRGYKKHKKTSLRIYRPTYLWPTLFFISSNYCNNINNVTVLYL